MAESFSSYVKFLRGSETAYKNLKYKKSDTLYFVTTAEGAGKLYLGETLIASGVNDSYIESYLKNLKDVNILGATNKSLLGYDSSSGKWVPMNPGELIKIDNVIGASEFRDGLAGLVPAPKRGDEKKVLRGDGTWASVQASTTVNADNINGLNEWIAANRNNI